MQQKPQIAGILFDKDGTLLDFDASWGPVNREVALMAADGDQALADRLLSVCGMDPLSGAIVPDSLFAAGNTLEIAEGMINAGSPYMVEALVPKIDDCFAKAAEWARGLVLKARPSHCRCHACCRSRSGRSRHGAGRSENHHP